MHLKSLLEFVETYGIRETNFDSIYQKLLTEYESEKTIDSNLSSNPYLNNLRQTIEKQAESYKAAKKRKPKKGAPSEFQTFVSNFKQDIREAISRISIANPNHL